MSIFTKASNSSYWRGYDYFKEGFVTDFKKVDDDVYSAKVKGTKTYEVKVDLKHPLNSSCTCPFVEGNKKICKHMIAVAFKASPDECLRAKKAEEDYEYEMNHIDDLVDKIMEKKRKKIKSEIKSLSAKEAKERLANILINEEYDKVYNDIVEGRSYLYDETIEESKSPFDDTFDDLSRYEKIMQELELNHPLTNGITDWKIGDLVSHDLYGEGRVINIIDEYILEIDFDVSGRKKLVSSHWTLKRIKHN